MGGVQSLADDGETQKGKKERKERGEGHIEKEADCHKENAPEYRGEEDREKE